MVEVRDIAEGLWLWRQAHPAWRPGLDWEPEVSSFVVETKGEVVLLDPLAPRPSEQAVWSRFEQAPPTAAVWPWSLGLGFDQAQVIEGHGRQLVRSGQDAVGADGQPQHPGDMAAQLELALDNLEAVLAAGEMTLANIARLNVYTTEVDDLFKHWGTVKDRLAHADGRFATSVVGVTRLAAPQLLVLLEATAFDRPQISQPSGHSSTSSVPSVKLARAGLTRFHERVASGRVELEPSSPASLRVRGICALAEPAKRPPTYRERGSTVNIGRTTHARALGAGRGAHSQTA